MGRDEGDWPFRDYASQLRRPGERDELDELRRLPTREELGYPPEPEREPEPADDEPPAFLVDPAATAPAAPEPAPAEPAEEERAVPPLEIASEASFAAVVAPEEPVPAPEAPLQPEQPVVPEHAAGELQIPGGYDVLSGSPSGARRTVGVVVSRFNGDITARLLTAALEELTRAGVAQNAVTVMPVPGAFELPLAAMALARTRRYSCIVALGCVIRGETPHFDYVAGEAASGLQLAAIETGVPISFGVLTTETREQAEARIPRAADAVRSALEMADLFTRLRATAQA